MKVGKSVRLVLLGALVGAVGGLVLLQVLSPTRPLHEPRGHAEDEGERGRRRPRRP